MKFPSLFEFLKALISFSQRPELVPELIEAKRTTICDNCEHSSGKQCQVCTCYIPLKTKLSTESCPVRKWGEYFNEDKNGIQNS